MQIKELIAIGEEILEKARIADYKIDAEALLSYEIGYSKQKIFMNWIHEVSFERCESYFDIVNLRASGYPLQYITGEQQFMEHTFFVDENVLIPRPETEELVQHAIDMITANKKIKNVLDMCTGSGVIAVSLAAKFPGVKVTGADISEAALDVACRNADSICKGNNILFEQSDLFESIKLGRLVKKYDLIISNPPYIKKSVLPTLQREVYNHEPLLALDGGVDGLDFYRKIISDAIPYFSKNGCLLLEIGHDQAEDVHLMLEKESYKDVEIIKDLSGRDRIVKAFR